MEKRKMALRKPTACGEHMKYIQEQGMQMAHDIVAEAIISAHDNNQLTTNMLINEQAGIALVALTILNVVKQNMGTQEEYMESFNKDLAAILLCLETEGEMVPVEAGGVEMVVPPQAEMN